MELQESKTYIDDLDDSIKNSIGIEKIVNKRVLVTGATGTIGSFVADLLLRYNQIGNAGIELYLAGRSIEKLKNRYVFWKDNRVRFVPYDIFSKVSFDFSVDYIIHAAGNAHPTTFSEDPVGTIIGNIEGTFNLLEYGRRCCATRFLYVSSGEIYGQGNGIVDEFPEDYEGRIEILSPRSCYPMSKRATENLCAAYTKQYGLETVVVRPCHTYGPGFTSNDSRANAQFFRNALNGEDIVLKSSGMQYRSYSYISDCASAILTCLLEGESGQAYNSANPNSRITIAGLAQKIAGCAGCKVVYAEPTQVDLNNRSPIPKQVMSSKKIEALGWHGTYSIERGIEHTLKILRGE